MRQLKINQQITTREDNSVNLYFQEINRYPMISAEEEVDLSVRIRNGDDTALQKLVLANLRFVISVAKQYQNQGLSFPDLINEGNVGLVKAARKFDETRGFKFISYAVWWIRQSIIQAICEQTRTVRLPMNRISSLHKISKAKNILEQQFEREPTESEIADHLEVDIEKVFENNQIKNRQVSFDRPISNYDDDQSTLYDIIQKDTVPRPDSKLNSESLSIDVMRVLKKLNPREYKILTLSYGLDNQNIHSLREIADLLQMSSERVRQIKTAGLHKLKALLKGNTCYQDNN